MLKIKKIYFMGIKGVGMASLAVVAKQAGIKVAGSDIGDEFITDGMLGREKIQIFTGFNPQNVQGFIKGSKLSEILFVATGAHNGFDNVEAKFAKEKGINIISQGQAVGVFMKGEIFGKNNCIGISVSGSHGKTTISGMLASSLSYLRMDPSYLVGTSEIFPIGSAGHFGRGDYFIAEADEYLSEPKYDRTPKLHYHDPKFLIINNIDFDHPDFYNSIDDVEKAFDDLIKKMKTGSTIIANGDDERVRKLIKDVPVTVNVITYGQNLTNDFVIEKFHQGRDESSYTVRFKSTHLGSVSLCVPGFHNAKNSLAVVALLLEIGVSFENCKKSLYSFLGTKRRMEKLGKTANGIIIIDDYAHHPEEIKKTLSSLRTYYPSKKIVVVFQPHTFSRTKALVSDFVSSFTDASDLILLPTFASLRDSENKSDENEKILLEQFQKINKNVVMLKNIDSVVEYVNKNYSGEEALILTMGAGDVYKVGKKLI